MAINRMKILVALHVKHKEFDSIDDILDGRVGCSGSVGTIVRLANLLKNAGFDVSLSAASKTQSSRFSCVQHESVKAENFDCLIAHQSHWDKATLTFGNQVISKTILYLQNPTSWAFVHTFLRAGGQRIICPSIYHANTYRAVPQWRRKVSVIHNLCCPSFQPLETEMQQRLLFIGSISPAKGFTELMDLWSYLAHKQADLKLAIAGDINLYGVSAGGSLGLAESTFETKKIRPWLASLPTAYQPQFLGTLSPVALREEIAKSWAVVVNPSWRCFETFCNSAVDAQACDRTVFSVAMGALPETVYCEGLNSLSRQSGVEDLGDLIIKGLSEREAVIQNGHLAGEFVRREFNHAVILENWLKALRNEKTQPTLPYTWKNKRDFRDDLLRWSRTSMLVERYKRYKGTLPYPDR